MRFKSIMDASLDIMYVKEQGIEPFNMIDKNRSH